VTENSWQYSVIEERLAKKFPALVLFDTRRLVLFLRDPHSILYGEMRRWRILREALERKRSIAERQGYTESERMELLERELHDFFVGDLSRASGRKTLPMYAGTPADFERNKHIWKDACRDVEEMYDYLTKYLPRYLMSCGRSYDRTELLCLPDEVRKERNPICLIQIAQSGGRDDSEWVRHCARVKLVLAQAFFEYRRAGFAHETLEDFSLQVQHMVECRLLKRNSRQETRIIAELDSSDVFACQDFWFCENPREIISASPARFVMEANRYTVVCKGGEEVPILFSVRPKRFPVLKGLVKDIRFSQLANIGDTIAMAFIVDDEQSLDKIVSEVRRIVVPCPGSVCDQNSNLGWREGRSLDASNPISSAKFRAMKYNALVADRVVEVQFVLTRNYIESKCRRDDAHHGCYKAKQYFLHVFPILFPEKLRGIPWLARGAQDKRGTFPPKKNEEIWEQIKAHVYARPHVTSF